MSTARDRQHSAPSCGSFMPAALAAGHGHRCAVSSAGKSGTLAACKVPEDAVTDQADAVVVPCSNSMYCPDSSTPAPQLWADVRPGQDHEATQPAGQLISAKRTAAEDRACPAPKLSLSWRQQLIRPLYPELRPASAQSQPSSSKPDQVLTDIQGHKAPQQSTFQLSEVWPLTSAAPALRPQEVGVQAPSWPEATLGRLSFTRVCRLRTASYLGKFSPQSGASGTMSPRQRQAAAALADADDSQKMESHSLAQRIQQRYAKQAPSSKGAGNTSRSNALNGPSRLSGQQKENYHPACQGGQPQAATQRRAAGSAQKLPSSAAHRAPRCTPARRQQVSAALHQGQLDHVTMLDTAALWHPFNIPRSTAGPSWCAHAT